MAEKKNMVSIRAIDEARKSGYSAVSMTANVDWLGVKIEVKHAVGLSDVIQIANEVAEGCFLEDGRYVPEIKEFLFRKSIMEHYTNVRLPQSAEKQYDLLICTDIVPLVAGSISEEQLGELRDAIDDKIDYLCDEALSTERARLNALIAQFSAIGEKIESIFGGVSGEDIASLVQAVGENGVDEKALMDRFIEHKYGEQPTEE